MARNRLRARSRQFGDAVPLSAVPDRYKKAYKAKHWGISAEGAYFVSPKRRPDIPDYVIEMGKSRGFIVVDDDGNELEILWDASKTSSVTFSDDKAQTIFMTSDAGLRTDIRDMFWVGGGPVYTFEQVCKVAGGRQAKLAARHCPHKKVRVIGHAQDILYSTHKKGDGPSTYIHRFGEDGGSFPILCCDKFGDLFLAGGTYIVTDHGIEN